MISIVDTTDVFIESVDYTGGLSHYVVADLGDEALDDGVGRGSMVRRLFTSEGETGRHDCARLKMLRLHSWDVPSLFAVDRTQDPVLLTVILGRCRAGGAPMI